MSGLGKKGYGKCPLGLRGDLTKWFQEIDTGVYVGNVSARVRDLLWKRICERCGSGRAIMVFSARNEQGYSFYIYNTAWKPVEFDGIVLLKKPLPIKRSVKTTCSKGKKRDLKSDVAKRKRQVQLRPVDITEGILNMDIEAPLSFVALDIETTGLRSKEDSIIEVAVVRYEHGSQVDQYHALVNGGQHVPEAVTVLTGITDELLAQRGRATKDALDKVLSFIGDHVLIGHNAIFDIRFLREACSEANIRMEQIQYIDTVAMAKALCREAVDNFRLETLVKKYTIADRQMHRALPDAILAAELYLKLIEKQEEPGEKSTFL